jgi:hypothetical protein
VKESSFAEEISASLGLLRYVIRRTIGSTPRIQEIPDTPKVVIPPASVMMGTA